MGGNVVVNGVGLNPVAQTAPTMRERHPLLTHAAKAVLGLVLAGCVALVGWLLVDMRDAVRDNARATEVVPAIQLRVRSVEERQIKHETTLDHAVRSLERIERAVGAKGE